MRYLRSFGLGTLLLVCTSMPAIADEVSGNVALNAAIADIKARNEKMPNVRFAFTGRYQVIESKKGETHTVTVDYAFDPSKPKDTQYTIISPTKAENKKIYKETLKEFKEEQELAEKQGIDNAADRSLLFTDLDELASDGVKYLRETDSEYIFSFVPHDDESSDDEGDDEEEGPEETMSEKDKKRAAEMLDALRGKLAIRKTNNQFVWMQINAVKPFKPAKGIKIKEMNMMMNFSALPNGGPMVTTKVDSKARGKAVIIKFNEHEIFTTSNFEIK